jgi:hypothetical protein
MKKLTDKQNNNVRDKLVTNKNIILRRFCQIYNATLCNK